MTKAQSSLLELADGFFPFTLICHETPHYTSSPSAFRKAFVANKPDDMTWFAYDVIVKSSTEVEFVAYGMRDNYSGGVGNEVGRFSASVASAVTHEDIEREIVVRSYRRRKAELEAAEQAIIAGYADELRAALRATEHHHD